MANMFALDFGSAMEGLRGLAQFQQQRQQMAEQWEQHQLELAMRKQEMAMRERQFLADELHRRRELEHREKVEREKEQGRRALGALRAQTMKEPTPRGAALNIQDEMPRLGGAMGGGLGGGLASGVAAGAAQMAPVSRAAQGDLRAAAYQFASPGEVTAAEVNPAELAAEAERRQRERDKRLHDYELEQIRARARADRAGQRNPMDHFRRLEQLRKAYADNARKLGEMESVSGPGGQKLSQPRINDPKSRAGMEATQRSYEAEIGLYEQMLGLPPTKWGTPEAQVTLKPLSEAEYGQAAMGILRLDKDGRAKFIERLRGQIDEQGVKALEDVGKLPAAQAAAILAGSAELPKLSLSAQLSPGRQRELAERAGVVVAPAIVRPGMPGLASLLGTDQGDPAALEAIETTPAYKLTPEMIQRARPEMSRADAQRAIARIRSERLRQAVNPITGQPEARGY